MGLFKKGYEAQREEKARQEEIRENAGKKLWRFFISAPEKGKSSVEADVHFLTEEPINFMEHNIKSVRSGKEHYEQYTCTGKNSCPYCSDGDRPIFKGAFLVVDRREFEYQDKDGKTKTGSDQVRLFVQGTRVVSQLDRIHEKYGLSNREITIVRLGKGTETTYTIEKGDKEELTEREIDQLLPDKLREEYDGTMESLYDIVEDQLMMNTPNYSENDMNTEDEEEEDGDSIIGVEDEEEDRPRNKLNKRKSSLSSKKSLFKDSGSSKSLKKRKGLHR